jgi:outer membrane lipoprotein SlyB
MNPQTPPVEQGGTNISTKMAADQASDVKEPVKLATTQSNAGTTPSNARRSISNSLTNLFKKLTNIVLEAKVIGKRMLEGAGLGLAVGVGFGGAGALPGMAAGAIVGFLIGVKELCEKNKQKLQAVASEAQGNVEIKSIDNMEKSAATPSAFRKAIGNFFTKLSEKLQKILESIPAWETIKTVSESALAGMALGSIGGMAGIIAGGVVGFIIGVCELSKENEKKLQELETQPQAA